MRFVLIVEDGAGRSSLFVADNGSVYTLGEVLDLAKKGQALGLQIASRNGVSYLRAARKRVGIPALQDISVSSQDVLPASIGGIFKKTRFNVYWDAYQEELEKRAARGEVIISVDGLPFAGKEHVRSTLLSYKDHIFSAASQFHVDPFLLAAICIDEIIRLTPFEELRDKLLIKGLSINVSIGVGQVKLGTARNLIEKGYFNPNPADINLGKEQITKTSLNYLYPYVADPRNNVYFAAARIRSLIDEWKSKAGIEISSTIVATLYHLKYKPPHQYPKSNIRGEQIISEFLPLAKEFLD